MTYDELVLRSIGAAFTGDFTAAFGLSEKRGDQRKPIADDDDRDESDSDAAEKNYINFAEPERELTDTDDEDDDDAAC